MDEGAEPRRAVGGRGHGRQRRRTGLAEGRPTPSWSPTTTATSSAAPTASSTATRACSRAWCSWSATATRPGSRRTLSRDNAVFTFHGTNRALPPVNGRGTPRGAIAHRAAPRAVGASGSSSGSGCTNFGLDQVMLPLVVRVRAPTSATCSRCAACGARRRGTLQPPQLHGPPCALRLRGPRRGACAPARVAFSEPPWRMDDRRAEFMFTLSPGERIDLFVEAGAGEAEPPSRERFRQALADARRDDPPARAARRAAAQLRRRPRRLVRAVARRPRPADHRPADRPLSLSPASPGSRPRSAATASSPPGRCCGSIRRWPAAC